MAYYSHVIGNKAGYKRIDTDLNNGIKNMIICGKSGCGKSTFVKAYLKTKKIKTIEIDIDAVDKMDMKVFKKSIVQKAIVIDGIKFNIDNAKKLETKIKKLIEPLGNNNRDIIIIISNKKSAVFNKFKGSKLHALKSPNQKTIINHIEKTLTDEYEIIEKSLKVFSSKLYIKNDGDLRKINNDIVMLKSGNKTKKLKLTKLTNDFLEKEGSDKKYDNMYDVFNMLFKPGTKCPENLYYVDKFIIPNAVFSTYLLGKNNINNMDNIVNSIDSLASYDIISTNPQHGIDSYLSYLGVAAPMEYSGKVSKNINFPPNVGKESGIRKANNDRKIREKRRMDMMYF